MDFCEGFYDEDIRIVIRNFMGLYNELFILEVKLYNLLFLFEIINLLNYSFII